jgi:hypothetical protein
MGGHYINKQLIEISTSRSTCLELKENILPFISHTLSISRSVWDLFLVCSCWSRLFWRACQTSSYSTYSISMSTIWQMLIPPLFSFGRYSCVSCLVHDARYSATTTINSVTRRPSNGNPLYRFVVTKPTFANFTEPTRLRFPVLCHRVATQKCKGN